VTVLLALIAGLGAGALFAWLRLPIPAPKTWVGVVGIAGLTFGYALVDALVEKAMR
jgi:XapX domain-containing protein